MKSPLLIALFLGLLAPLGFAEPPQSAPLRPIRIALAGDSTVNGSGGWGNEFGACLRPEATCINLARNGRSSKSFYNDGGWKSVIESKPNFVFLQFGHNDCPGKGPDRETDPETTYRANMIRYIDEARAMGATPILVTSLSRRQFGADGKINSTLVPYVAAVLKIAVDKKVPVIDLHKRSIEMYEKLGKDGSEKTFSPWDDKKKVMDATHLSTNGRTVIGKLMAEEVKAHIPALASYVK